MNINKNKYIKYKNKYINYMNQYGGINNPNIIYNDRNIIYNDPYVMDSDVMDFIYQLVEHDNINDILRILYDLKNTPTNRFLINELTTHVNNEEMTSKLIKLLENSNITKILEECTKIVISNIYQSLLTIQNQIDNYLPTTTPENNLLVLENKLDTISTNIDKYTAWNTTSEQWDIVTDISTSMPLYKYKIRMLKLAYSDQRRKKEESDAKEQIISMLEGFITSTNTALVDIDKKINDVTLATINSLPTLNNESWQIFDSINQHRDLRLHNRHEWNILFTKIKTIKQLISDKTLTLEKEQRDQRQEQHQRRQQ